jgi:hypothetical protein
MVPYLRARQPPAKQRIEGNVIFDSEVNMRVVMVGLVRKGMKILNRLVGGSLLLILVIPSSLQAQERSSQETEKSCRRAVQGLYNRIVGKGPKYPSAVITPELRRQLKDDEENMMDESGLIQGLDFNPIAGGQDICDRYQVGKIIPKGKRYLAEVYCLWGNKRDMDKKMVHEVMFNRGRWMIMNIHYYFYEKGKPPTHSDLLSMLKSGREGRRKNSK